MSRNNKKLIVNKPFAFPLLDLQSGKINTKAIEEIEDKLNYTFNNSSLLISAFTHPSINKETSSNYQRLELLGDSILEIYLLVRLFLLRESNTDNKFFKSKDEKEDFFNCGNISHAKSLLASNNFLIKLSVFLNLQEHILISDKNSISSIETFFNNDNIANLLRTNLNQYEEDPINCAKPKILSDVFESLLGAILIDSNLENCFNFLDSVFIPYLVYTAVNFGEIKYSAVSEFIELVQKKYGVGPRFSKEETNNKLVEVKAWAGDILISKGTAKSEDRAKDIAAIEGIKLLK